MVPLPALTMLRLSELKERHYQPVAGMLAGMSQLVDLQLHSGKDVDPADTQENVAVSSALIDAAPQMTSLTALHLDLMLCLAPNANLAQSIAPLASLKRLRKFQLRCRDVPAPPDVLQTAWLGLECLHLGAPERQWSDGVQCNVCTVQAWFGAFDKLQSLKVCAFILSSESVVKQVALPGAAQLTELVLGIKHAAHADSTVTVLQQALSATPALRSLQLGICVTCEVEAQVAWQALAQCTMLTYLQVDAVGNFLAFEMAAAHYLPQLQQVQHLELVGFDVCVRKQQSDGAELQPSPLLAAVLQLRTLRSLHMSTKSTLSAIVTVKYLLPALPRLWSLVVSPESGYGLRQTEFENLVAGQCAPLVAPHEVMLRCKRPLL
jgi:hypothetical protein